MDFNSSPNQGAPAAGAAGAKTPVDHTKWSPGKYKAKAIDWGTAKTKEGLPQAKVLFTYIQKNPTTGAEEAKDLMWFGSFKGGALERTMETLFGLGLRADPSTMDSGRDGKALDETVEVEIVVEHRVDQTGQMRAGISWVNSGNRKMGSLDAQEAQQVFAQANAEYRIFLAKQGVSPNATAPAGATAAGAPRNGAGPAPTIAQAIAAPASTMTEEDLPF